MIEAAPPQGDEATQSAARRRTPVAFYVVDRELNVLYRSPDDPFSPWRERTGRAPSPGRLPAAIASAARRLMVRWESEDGPDETFVFPLPTLVMRVVRLRSASGFPAAGLFLERFRRPRDLVTAAKRYNLSSRELDVVHLMVGGASYDEIGARLKIAKPTVAAHVRSAIQKTGSRRRAEMVAKLMA